MCFSGSTVTEFGCWFGLLWGLVCDLHSGPTYPTVELPLEHNNTSTTRPGNCLFNNSTVWLETLVV